MTTELNHQDTGTGDPVLLLHGGTLDLRMWDDQVAAFTAAGHRVIRFDARGHGKSPTPTSPFRQCDDVAALLDHLRIDRAALVGLSMGAGAATDTALEHPGRVSKLVVCGAGTNEPTFDDPWMRDVQRRMAEAQQRLDAPAWIELSLVQGLIGPYRTAADVDPVVLARTREMMVDTVRNHVRPDAVPPEHVPGSWERLGEIRVPALGVYGRLDAPDHRGMVERFAAAVAGCRTVVLEKSAHLPNMEQPAEFNAAVLGFLADQ